METHPADYLDDDETPCEHWFPADHVPCFDCGAYATTDEDAEPPRMRDAGR